MLKPASVSRRPCQERAETGVPRAERAHGMQWTPDVCHVQQTKSVALKSCPEWVTFELIKGIDSAKVQTCPKNGVLQSQRRILGQKPRLHWSFGCSEGLRPAVGVLGGSDGGNIEDANAKS